MPGDRAKQHANQVRAAFKDYIEADATHHVLDERLKARLGLVEGREAMIGTVATYAKYAGSLALTLSAGGSTALIDYMMGAYKGVCVAKVLDYILPNQGLIHAIDYLAPDYLATCDAEAVAQVAESAMHLAGHDLRQACADAPLDAVIEGIGKLLDQGLPEKESGLCGLLMLQAVGLECQRQGKDLEVVRDDMVAGIEQGRLMMQAEAGAELDADQLALLKEKSPKTAQAIMTVHSRIQQQQANMYVKRAIESSSQIIIGLGVLAGEPRLVQTGVVARQVTEVSYAVYQIKNQLGTPDQWLSVMGAVNSLIQLMLSFRQQQPSLEMVLLKQVNDLSRQLHDAKHDVLSAIRDEHQYARWQLEDCFEGLGDKIDVLESSVALRQQMMGLALSQKLIGLGEQVGALHDLCQKIYAAQDRTLATTLDRVRRGRAAPRYFKRLSFDAVDDMYAQIFSAAQRRESMPGELSRRQRLEAYRTGMQNPDRSILIVLSAMEQVRSMGQDVSIILPRCWLTMLGYLETVIQRTEQHAGALNYAIDELQASAGGYLSLVDTATQSVDDHLLQACSSLKSAWRAIAQDFETSMMHLLKAASISNTTKLLTDCRRSFQRAFDPAVTATALDDAVPVDRTERVIPSETARAWDQYGKMLARSGPAAVIIAPFSILQMALFITPATALGGQPERREVREKKRYENLIDEAVLMRYRASIQSIFSKATDWMDTINFADLIKVVSATSQENCLHHVRAAVPVGFYNTYLPARVMFMRLNGHDWPLPVSKRLTETVMNKLRDESPMLLTDLLIGRVKMTLMCQLQSSSRVDGWPTASALPKDHAKYDVYCVLSGAVARRVKVATATRAYPGRAEKPWLDVLSECEKTWAPVAMAMILQLYGHRVEPTLGVWDMIDAGVTSLCAEHDDRARSQRYLLQLQQHICQRWQVNPQLSWPGSISSAQRPALNAQLTQLATQARTAIKAIEFSVAEMRALMHVMGVGFRNPNAALYGSVHFEGFLKHYLSELGVYDNSGAGLFGLQQLLAADFQVVPTTGPWCYRDVLAAKNKLTTLSTKVSVWQARSDAAQQQSGSNGFRPALRS